MKIIFLDIDGVLATDKEYMTNRTKFREKYPEAMELHIPYPFNEDAVKVFNEILDETGCQIVLSSDWRFHWDLEEIDRIFKFNGVKKSPIGYTIKSKRKMSSDLEDDRVWQIKNYIETYNVKKWVAVDDLNLSSLGENFILTEDTEGVKKLGVKEKIIEILNSEI